MYGDFGMNGSFGRDLGFIGDFLRRITSVSEVHEDTDTYVLSFDTPGFKVDELRLSIENHVLRVRGRSVAAGGERTVDFLKPLPELVDVDSATADLADGVLLVTFTKHEPEEHVIPIKVKVRTADERPADEAKSDSSSEED